MKLSARKTVMMKLTGTLDLGRPPTIYQQGRQIKLVPELKYLGVTLESGITGVKIGKHIKESSTRCRNLFVAVMNYAAPTWIETSRVPL